MSNRRAELELQLVRLNDSRDSIIREIREVSRELREIEVAEGAAVLVAAMDDDERAALLQVLRPMGIPSEETFGVPGS